MGEQTTLNIQIPVNREYEVIVAGGGPAGCAAAAAAAREGAKVLLLEASGMLGGMATKGLVTGWTPFSDQERIIYGGLAERVFRTLQSKMPFVPRELVDWAPIDPEWLKMIYDGLLSEYGADVLFHSMVCGVRKEEQGVKGLIVSNKAGLTQYEAPVFVDCTGDADIAFWGGNEMAGDDLKDCQPSSLCFMITNVDMEAYLRDQAWILDREDPESPLGRIVADPELSIPDKHFCLDRIGTDTLGFNAGHIWLTDPTDPRCLSEAMVRGRRMARDFLTGLKKYAPAAFGKADLAATAPTIGLRESRRILGDYVFTLEDYVERRVFPDDIGRNNYYIDIHSCPQNPLWDDNKFEHYKKGESHGVPYRILCPKDLRNVLVAGRTVSSDRITQGSLRIMPCCLVQGEAAGIAAAMAAREPVPDIHRIPVRELQRRLREEGAYLPEHL